MREMAHWLGWVRSPNERDSHRVPTARGGGIAILIGIATAAFLTGVSTDFALTVICALAVGMAVVGLLDDAMNLPATAKLAAQIVASAAIVLIPHYRTGPLLAALAIVWIAGVTNAFNFMDGVNGIAALEAMISGLVMGLLLLRAGDVPGGMLCFAIAGGAAGFFPWNAFSGSIFMGDVGSLPLGFLFAALVVRGAHHGIAPWVMGLPLLPFLLDTGLTLVRRVVRRERIFEAHRTHAYQRLTDLGWSHLGVTLLWGALAAAGGAVALAWDRLEAFRLMAMAGVVALHGFAFVAVATRHRRLRSAD
jgi:Fuc2NAc and GlcNAc transferase